jgi:hypothetical protein
MEPARALAAAFAAAAPATPVSGLMLGGFGGFSAGGSGGGAGGSAGGGSAHATVLPSPLGTMPSLKGLIAQKTAELAAASEARLGAVNARLRCALRAACTCEAKRMH